MKRTILILFLLLFSGMSGWARDHSSFSFHVASNFGIFSPKEGDPISLVYPLLIDSQGRRTGYNPVDTSAPPFAEIPGSSAGGERIDSDVSEELGTDIVIIAVSATPTGRYAIQPVPAGNYSLIIFSTVSYGVAYSFGADITDSSGHDESSGNITTQGFLSPGMTATYTINYNPAPGSAVTVIKTVTFAILRQELQAAFQLGQIGDAKFVKHLDKILAEGEKALAPKPEEKREAGKAQEHKQGREKPNKKKAIEKLKEFIHQLEEAARTEPQKKHGDGQFKKDDRGDHDRDHEHKPERFVTVIALKSLTDDARTLITQLGGKPEGDHNDRGQDHGDHDNKNH